MKNKYRWVFIIPAIAIAPFAIFSLLSTVYLIQGDRLFESGQTEKAFLAYQTVLNFNVDSDRAYLQIGRLLQKQKRYPEALEAYKRAFLINPNLQFNPADAPDFLALAKALNSRSLTLEALEAYRYATIARPEGDTYFQLGRALYDLRRWDEALTAFRTALKFPEPPTPTYFYLARSYAAQQLWDEASSAYRQALEKDPGNTDIYLKLGESLEKKDLLDEAIDIYRQALIYKQTDGDIYHRLGKALQEKKLPDQALEAYNQAHRLSPKNALIQESLCYVNLQLGQLDEGLKWCASAVKLDPDLADARFTLQEITRGRLIHDNPDLLKMPEVIPDAGIDPLVSLKRSIVKVIVRGAKNSQGTGWILSIDGDRALIVTNRHVVTDSKQQPLQDARIFVEYYSRPPAGRIRKRSRAKILHRTEPNDPLDLAVLEVRNPPTSLQPLTISPLPLQPPAPVMTIGHPFNLPDWNISKGTVSNNTRDTLLLSMLVALGQSGSPVFNSKNQVVGVISQAGLFCPGSIPSESLQTKVNLGCGIAIPIERIQNKLTEWGIKNP